MLKIEDFQFFQRSINSSNDQQNEQSTTVLAELTEHKKNHDIWRWKSKSWHKDVWIYDTLIKVICIITETWLQVFATIFVSFQFSLWCCVYLFVLFCFVLFLFLCCCFCVVLFDFFLLFLVGFLFAQCCQCLWIVHSWLPLRFSPTYL